MTYAVPRYEHRGYPYRSRPERDIADLLGQHRIPFIYEKPTAVIDSGFMRLVYPDFTLRYGLLIEYFGVNGDPEYAARTRHKLQVYEENQMDAIPLYPTDMSDGWQMRVLDRIDTALETRLSGYRSRISAAQPGRGMYVRPGRY